MEWKILSCRHWIELMGLGEPRTPLQRIFYYGHLALCASCRAYLRTYRGAIAMARNALLGVTTEVPEELVQSILRMR